jgi:transcriptional regulator of acetoin/glycerol metabolism
MLQGATISGAAETAGVDRATIHRWLRCDWAFQAAHNSLRCQLQREVERRLDQVQEAAVETVSKAINDGNVTAALTVLRGIGLLSDQARGELRDLPGDPVVPSRVAPLREAATRTAFVTAQPRGRLSDRCVTAYR